MKLFLLIMAFVAAINETPQATFNDDGPCAENVIVVADTTVAVDTLTIHQVTGEQLAVKPIFKPFTLVAITTDDVPIPKDRRVLMPRYLDDVPIANQDTMFSNTNTDTANYFVHRMTHSK